MLETLYYFKANERTREAVFWVAKALERALSEQKYEPCREFLRLVSKRLDAVPAESLGSILTATYVARAKLGAERSELHKSVVEFYGRLFGPEKAARALSGLA